MFLMRIREKYNFEGKLRFRKISHIRGYLRGKTLNPAKKNMTRDDMTRKID